MLFTDTLIPVYLVTGFTVGFGHCIGMCGPIVVSFSLNLGKGNIYLPHGLYHFGRLLTYTILGGIMGVSGSFTAVTAHMAGIQKGVFIFTGLMIVVMGFVMTGWLPAMKLFGDYSNPAGFISLGFRNLLKKASAITFLPLGLLLGLLPCGPVYTALIGAARVGMEAATPAEGILSGMGLMAAFGIGTIPALILVGRLAKMTWLKKRVIIYRIGAILMILVGIGFIFKAIRL